MWQTINVNTSILLVFLGLALAAAIAAVVVFVAIRFRSPEEGVRQWVKESADAWTEEELEFGSVKPRDTELSILLEDSQKPDVTEDESLGQAVPIAGGPMAYKPRRKRPRPKLDGIVSST